MQKPQIIVIPQNLLSEQSKNFLKQRQVFPNITGATVSTVGQSVKPIAAVMGHARPAVTVVTTSSPTSTALKRPISPYKPAFAPVEIEVKEEDDEIMSLAENQSDGAPPKKRANLDHLSAEERLMRRKLKNRVAAQTARDKKKAYIDELEELMAKVNTQLKQVTEEKCRLQENNATLQLENASLLQRNRDLEARLGLNSRTNLTTPFSLENNRVDYTLPLSPAASPQPMLRLAPTPPCSPPIMSTSVNTGASVINASPATSATAAATVVVSTPPEPAVLDPLQQESGVAPPLPLLATIAPLVETAANADMSRLAQPDPELSSNDLTTWSSHCALLMLTWSMILLSLKRQPSLSTPASPLKSSIVALTTLSKTTCISSTTTPLKQVSSSPPPLLPLPANLSVPLKKRVKWHTLRTLRSPPMD